MATKEPNREAHQDDDNTLPYGESIFLLAKDGNLKAQGQIVTQHQTMVRCYVAVLCGDPDVSDDLAQETFLRALQRFDQVGSADKLEAYLRGIARNVVREHFRRTKSRKSTIDRFMKWGSAEWDAQAGDGSVTDGATHLEEQLHICLKRLPDGSRRLIQLRYEEGMNSTEISSKLPLKPEAIRTAIGRIRRKLQSCLENLDTSTS